MEPRPHAASPTPPPRRRRRRHRGRVRSSRLWRWGRWVVLVFVLAGGAGAGALGYLYATVDLPPVPPAPQSSVVLDAKGRTLAILARHGVRRHVALENVSPTVTEALIAAEDRNFRHNRGVDPRGMVRALVNNARGRPTQGGSTISQQLVKNTFLSPQRSYSRKVREAILAVKLDQRMSKDRILERYLNVVYFGRGAYGIEAAADEYFGTSASKLTYRQAALLIGLLRAPESADPGRAPEVALARRNSVLDDLAEVHDLTALEARWYKATPLGARRQRSLVTLRAGVGPHAVEWIRSEAVKRFGAGAVYGGGLVIHSTIDIDKQRAAEDAVRSVLDRPDDPQVALVALDARGGVAAEVGGRDFSRLKVDLARGAEGGGGGRQAGSAFKPLVLASAIDDGVATLGTRYPGPPKLTLPTPAGPWTVRNFGGESFGDIDLTTATEHSVNTAYAQLMMEANPLRVMRAARNMGVQSPLAPNPSLVLGTSDVSVVDVATAYATLGRDGRRLDAHIIDHVEDADGALIFRAPTSPGVQVIKQGTARAVNAALQQVIADGTGTRARLDRPAAGKTGTTQDYGDAWFSGYTPNFTATVWMGYPEGPAHRMTDVHGRSVTGGSFPAEIWKRFMDAALVGVPPEPFPAPPADLLAPPRSPSRRSADASVSGRQRQKQPAPKGGSGATKVAPGHGGQKGGGSHDPLPVSSTTILDPTATTSTEPPTTTTTVVAPVSPAAGA